MNFLRALYTIWSLRKETKYILRTGKIPLCWCKPYLSNSDCVHIEEARKQIGEFMKDGKQIAEDCNEDMKEIEETLQKLNHNK